jgi:membrane protein required for colicin V production
MMRSLFSQPWLASLLAYASVFLAVFIPLAFLSHRISQGVKNSPIGPLDRAAGVGFGILRGLVIVGLAYLAFTYFIPIREHPRWLTHAELLPMVQNTSEVILSVVPDQPTDFAFIPSHREKPSEKGVESPQRASSHDPMAELIRANGDANRVSKTIREPVQRKGAGTAQKSYGATDRKALDTLVETGGAR